VLLLAACGGGANKKLSSAGAPYEVVVIAESADWRAAGLGDTINSVLGAPVPQINNYEPQFDVFHILPTGFDATVRRNGNLMIVQLGDKFTRPEIAPRPDEFASPQMVAYAVAPDAATLAKHISENGEQLREMFNSLERTRWTALARKAPSVEMQKRVKEKFGVGIALNNGFILGKEAADFLWLRFRYPESDQELTIYTYPAAGELTMENMVAARDRFVSLIPGEVPDSHMITATEYVDPVVRTVTIDGREWVEMRGLWEVKNDFMGGPFVSYSTVVDGRVLVVDGAVFSPSPYKMKRNLLRQLESVVHSIKL
jgi:hypothetical protein